MTMAQQTDLKQRLVNLSAQEWDDLKAAILYRRLRGQLRGNGGLNVVLGLLTLWLGLFITNAGIFSLVQTILGVAIVLVSIYALRQTTVLGIRLFTGLFLVVGVWNLFLAIRGNFAGGAMFMGVLGLTQLWGSWSFQRAYQRYSAQNIYPTPAATTLLEQIHATLKRQAFVSDPDYIEIQIYRRRWNGFLLNERAILSYKDRPYLIVAEKNDFIMLTRKDTESNPNAWQDVAIQLEPNMTTVGRIQSSFFERYSHWRDDLGIPYGMLNSFRNRLNVRHAIRIIAILLLVAVGVGAICMTSIIASFS